MEESITLEFELNSADLRMANLLSASLQTALQGASRDVQVTRHRLPGAQTQDGGTLILAVLTTHAAALLAKALGDWLVKTQSAEITIRKNGDVTIKNGKSRDILAILDRILPPGG